MLVVVPLPVSPSKVRPAKVLSPQSMPMRTLSRSRLHHSLPTGGGAIRGIGGKFIANPFTGTGGPAMSYEPPWLAPI
jgi:hypothetical protein